MFYSRFFFYLFLSTAFFGYRRMLFQFTTGFDEYEAIFLYASDILMFLFLGAAAHALRRESKLAYLAGYFKKHTYNFLPIFLILFLVLAGISVFPAAYKFIALYDFLRLIFLVLMAVTLSGLIKKGMIKFKFIFLILVILGIFEAVIGFGQFVHQGSLGLRYLGESYLPPLFSATGLAGPFTAGIAKVDIGGTKLLRAYGTFPHPNVLSAFLLLSLLSLYYFWMSPVRGCEGPQSASTSNGMSSEFSWREFFKGKISELKMARLFRFVGAEIFIGAGIFLIWLGLLFTFSRTAWAIGILFSLFWVGYFIFRREYRRRAVKLAVILIATLALLVFSYNLFIFPRAQISTSEPSVSYRLAYNDLGFKIIKENLLGVGMGNQVIYAVKQNLYAALGMPLVWQWQPVHNIYLLMAAELGVLGLLVFLCFLALLIFNVIRNKNIFALDVFSVTALFMLFALSLFGLSDHFLWTLQPGRLMLWLVIGMVLATTNFKNEVA